MTEENWTKTGQELVISYDGKAVLLWFCFPRFYFENVFKRQKEKKRTVVCVYRNSPFRRLNFFSSLDKTKVQRVT